MLLDQPPAAEIEALLVRCWRRRLPIWIASVNLGEVWYTVARRYSRQSADLAIAQLLRSGVEPAPVDWLLANEAAAFKSRFRLCYADCFAAALAKQRNGILLTGDLELRCLDAEIKIHWLA
jgi:predicted nucleic acid-binding protein